MADELLDDRLELGGQQLVSLVHHQHARRGELGDSFRGQVEQAPRGGDDGVHRLVQSDDVVAEGGPSRRHHHLGPQVLPELPRDLRGLQGQFTSRHQDHGLDLVAGRVEPLEDRDAEGRGLARAVFGAREDVAAG